MKPEKRVKIPLTKDVYRLLEKGAKEAGYKTVDDFFVFLVHRDLGLKRRN